MFPLAFSMIVLNRRVFPTFESSNWKSGISHKFAFIKSFWGIDTMEAFIRMVGWLDLGPVAQVFIFVEVAFVNWFAATPSQECVCCVVQPPSVDKGLRIHDHPLDHSARNKPISSLKLRMKHWVFPFSERPWENGFSLLGITDFSRKTYHSFYWLYLWRKKLMLSWGFWFSSFGWIPEKNPERGRVTRGKRFAFSLKAFAKNHAYVIYMFIWIHMYDCVCSYMSISLFDMNHSCIKNISRSTLAFSCAVSSYHKEVRCNCGTCPIQRSPTFKGS